MVPLIKKYRVASTLLGQDVEPRPVQGHARRSPTGLHAEGPVRMTARRASVAARVSGPGPGRNGSVRRIAKQTQRNSAAQRAQRTRFLLRPAEAKKWNKVVPVIRSTYTRILRARG